MHITTTPASTRPTPVINRIFFRSFIRPILSALRLGFCHEKKSGARMILAAVFGLQRGEHPSTTIQHPGSTKRRAWQAGVREARSAIVGTYVVKHARHTRRDPQHSFYAHGGRTTTPSARSPKAVDSASRRNDKNPHRLSCLA